MGNEMTLADCVRLAEFAHYHQYDKSGAPYIDHPKRVLASVQAQGAQPHVQMAAVLHDVTEDTPFTAQMLLDLGVPEAAVDIVKLVDRDISAESYRLDSLGASLLDMEGHGFNSFTKNKDEYYYSEIKKNPGAVQVKLADIGDNLQPWRLAYLSDETQARLREKYAGAIRALN